MPKIQMRHWRWFSNTVCPYAYVQYVYTWSKIQSWWSWYWSGHLLTFDTRIICIGIGICIVKLCKLLQITSYFNRGSGFQKSSSRAATAAFISVTSGARRGSYNNVDASYASAGISLAVTNPQTWPPNKICWFWHTLKIHLKYMLNTYFYRP